jgi:probable phosphoglycerate mutase
MRQGNWHHSSEEPGILAPLTADHSTTDHSTKTEATLLTTRIILVRHGESSFNVERRVQGHIDQSLLTETGQADARKVGAAFADLQFDAVYSSPLQRAKQTVEIILSCLTHQPAAPLQTTDLLKEINLVQWEGLLFTEVEERYPEAYAHWHQAPHLLKMELPASEGGTEFYPVPALYDQAKDFWKELLPRHAGQTVLVVAHSGINRALISTAIGLPPARYQSIHQSNCGISVLNFAGGWGEPVQLESINLTAHLGERIPKRRKGHSGPRLLLVRHGETDWNRDQRFQGQIDVPLNQRGRSQSQQAAEFLQPVTIHHAVSSPMLRPKETAEIILQHHPDVPLELLDGLKEINHGLWEGKLEAEIRQVYDELLQHWQKTPEIVQMPEGENLQQVWERAIATWKQIVEAAAAASEVKTVMVVAHDAINKAILCSLVGLGPESFWNFKQGNGAVSVIDYPQGADSQPVISAMNITTHLGSVLDKTAAGAL